MSLSKILSTAGILLSLPYAMVGMFQNTVCSVQEGYVIDNKQPSRVVLYAHYPNKGLFAEDIYISIEDISTNKVIATIKPSVDSGYKPSIILINTQSGALVDIMLYMDSGGSGGGGYCALYSVEGGNVMTLFDSDQYVASSPWQASYNSGYIATVTQSKRSYNIDLSGKGEQWLKEVYDDDGNVITSIQPYVADNATTFAYYNATQQVYQLQVWRPIVGQYNADRLGYVVEQLERVGNKFFPYFVSVAISQNYSN